MNPILPTINFSGLLVAFVPCVLIATAMYWMDRRKPTYRQVKPYRFGHEHYYRPITKPRSGTVTLQGGGSVDRQTGVVTGTTGGTWVGQFEHVLLREAGATRACSGWWNSGQSQ